jgi:hypothetical protein
MKLQTRETLKKFFQKGEMPGEASFDSLIDSMVNRVDDGFSKDQDHGLMLSPEGTSNNLVSFYRKIDQPNPLWRISIDADQKKDLGLSFLEPGAKEDTVRLFLQEGGNVGIGTTKPAYKLEVSGTVGMQSRIGVFKRGVVDANGKWQNILGDLNGCQAFEVVARVGQTGTGRYALLHSIAASTFGKSKNKITTTQAHYGWWWNKMKIRWSGTTFSYGLQLRSRHDYGKDVKIHYHIVKLWGDEEMGFPITNKT